MKAKLVTGKYFMERVLPESAAHLEAYPDRRRHHDGAARGGVLAFLHLSLLAGRGGPPSEGMVGLERGTPL